MKLKLYQLGKYVGCIFEEDKNNYPQMFTVLLLKHPTEYWGTLEDCKEFVKRTIGYTESREEK